MTLIGLDEHRYADACGCQSRHDWFKAVVLAGRINAALGGAFLALFRHDASGMRKMLESNGRHFIGGAPFPD